jgi:hypothetical protein
MTVVCNDFDQIWFADVVMTTRSSRRALPKAGRVAKSGETGSADSEALTSVRASLHVRERSISVQVGAEGVKNRRMAER